MSDLTKDEFTNAVAATIGSAHHFYREVSRLYVALRETLQSEPDPFLPIGGFPARPSRAGDRTIVRNYYGQLFEPNLAGDEDTDEEVEVEEDDDGDGEPGARAKKGPAELDPERPLLVVKLKLYDPQLAEKFEPQVEYAVLGEWAAGPTYRKPKKKGEPFKLSRAMLRRIIKAFDAAGGQVEGQRVMTRAMIKREAGVKPADRQISYRMLGPAKCVPVFELDSAESLETVGKQIQAHWRDLTG